MFNYLFLFSFRNFKLMKLKFVISLMCFCILPKIKVYKLNPEFEIIFLNENIKCK